MNPEIIAIATSTIAFVSPYLVKTGEKIAEEIGESVWNLLKKTFVSKDESDIVIKIEENPESLESLAEFNNLLIEKMGKDNEFKENLFRLIDNAKKLEMTKRHVSQYGDKALYIEKNDGNITIN